MRRLCRIYTVELGNVFLWKPNFPELFMKVSTYSVISLLLRNNILITVFFFH